MTQNTCSTCRYWSDQQAGVNAHGELVARCLSKRSEWARMYMPGERKCWAWMSGHEGAIDAPDGPIYDPEPDDIFKANDDRAMALQVARQNYNKAHNA